jgi:hypothetical protein
MCNNWDSREVIVQGSGILSMSGRCDALVFGGATRIDYYGEPEENTEPQ